MDTIFAFYLWFIIFSILCWLVTPETVIIEKEEQYESEIVEEINSLTHQDTLDGVEIEKINYEEMRLAEKGNDNHRKNIELLEIAVKTLNIRQARKVAGKLGISQKVNGKDAPKNWLIRQINAKLETHQQEVRDGLNEVVNVA